MEIVFPQTRPVALERLQTPEQGDIVREPLYRRADVDFMRKQGGDIVRSLIAAAEQRNMLTDDSRVMVQRSPVAEYPSKWNWHLDHMPGTSGYYSLADVPLRATRQAKERHQFVTLEFSRKHLQRQLDHCEAARVRVQQGVIRRLVLRQRQTSWRRGPFAWGIEV